MRTEVLQSCESLIESREQIKMVFGWDNSLMHLTCAAIYVTKGQTADISVLEGCRQLIKENVGLFNNFRGTGRSPIAAMLATSENPKQTLDRGIQVYDLLKRDFSTSTYLPITAMVIAQFAKPNQFEDVATRTRVIYKRMRAEHPFLTSSEDSANCALLALSDKSDDRLLNEMEACYQLLKPHFFSANAVQSLSHILALGEGTPELLCNKTLDLLQALKTKGYNYGTTFELPTLGVLAMSGRNIEELTMEMIEIDQWLSTQKGFGFFSSITKKQRLMYAGILAQIENSNQGMIETNTINSAISIIVAQEAAMCAMIAASGAAAASSSSSTS